MTANLQDQGNADFVEKLINSSKWYKMHKQKKLFQWLMDHLDAHLGSIHAIHCNKLTILRESELGESQNVLGWKRLLKIIQSKPPATCRDTTSLSILQGKSSVSKKLRRQTKEHAYYLGWSDRWLNPAPNSREHKRGQHFTGNCLDL